MNHGIYVLVKSLLSRLFIGGILFLQLLNSSDAVAQQIYIYDLNWDWSDTSNPNGPWSYKEGSNILPHLASWLQGTGNFSSSQPAWARSASTSTHIPAWFKSRATPTFAADWQQGDVLVHSTDPGNGVGQGVANVSWTSPRDGTVDVFGAVWMGRNIGRGNDWAIYVKNNLLTWGHLQSGDSFDRNSPFDFAYGSGGERALTDIAVATGDTITLEISKTSFEGEFTGVELTILLTTPNTVPTISDIYDQTIVLGQSAGLIPFTVTDAETPASELLITVESSNQLLVPNQNILLGGSNSSRNLSVVPLAGNTGSATVKITVTDSGGKRATDTMLLTVLPESNNAAPSISDVPNQTILQNRTTGLILFTVSDQETDANALVITVQSSNQSLVPHADIQLGGSDNSRNLVITPTVGQTGKSLITIAVRDGLNQSAYESFELEVLAESPNTAPFISRIPDQSVIRNHSTELIPFRIDDSETPTSLLRLAVHTSNQLLTPEKMIVFGGSEGNRTLLITPATNQTGTATITIDVTDQANQTTSSSFQLNVQPPLLSISSLPDLSLRAGEISETISFSIFASETPIEALSLTVESSNEAVIPLPNILFSRLGAERKFVVVTFPDTVGTSTIKFTVTNPEGQKASDSFDVMVRPANTRPEISQIQDQFSYRNQVLSAISFKVNDLETKPEDLIVSASSSNSILVPNTNIRLEGAGTTRLMSITPDKGQEGLARITVTVTDKEGLIGSTTFSLVVRPDLSPTISAIGPQSILQNTTLGTIPFTIDDRETAILDLVVKGTSDNTRLLPNENIIITGTGSTRTVSVTPVKDQRGLATITLAVIDEAGNSSSTSFPLSVDFDVLRGDFDGDSVPEIVFQDGNGGLAAWMMNAQTVKAAQYFSPNNIGDQHYQLVSTGDFNLDGQEDLLFQHEDGLVAVWYMSGLRQVGVSFLNPSRLGDANWRVASVADFNQDGHADLIFQHTDGTIAFWLMNGTNVISASLLTPSNTGNSEQHLVGTGDFNLDGMPDLVFQHDNGIIEIWILDKLKLNFTVLTSPPAASESAWKIKSVGDWNKDGHSDLLFQHPNLGLGVWFLKGTSAISATLLEPSNPGGTWKVVGPK